MFSRIVSQTRLCLNLHMYIILLIKQVYTILICVLPLWRGLQNCIRLNGGVDSFFFACLTIHRISFSRCKMADEATRKAVSDIPLLKTNSGPRDKELWVQRLREEYLALIKVSQNHTMPRMRCCHTLFILHTARNITSCLYVDLASWVR